MHSVGREAVAAGQVTGDSQGIEGVVDERAAGGEIGEGGPGDEQPEKKARPQERQKEAVRSRSRLLREIFAHAAFRRRKSGVGE
jgi:hypothetical protein